MPGMAQTTQTILTDDLDGSEATQTITFAYRGTSYEIDLNDEHAHAIDESFAEWVSAARQVAGRSSAAAGPARAASGPKRGDLDAVRAWARENGHQVSDRGRVATRVLEAYDAAR